MQDTPKLKTSAFTSTAPARRFSPLPVRRANALPARPKQPKRAGSALIVLCVCMLCCGLLLSSLWTQEPFVETMAVSASEPAPSATDGDILGRLRFLFARVAEVFEKKELLLPIENGELTAAFSSEAPYAALCGEPDCPVRAAADGTVRSLQTDETGGSVLLDHDGGFQTRYDLLGMICVEEGQPVRAGDALGKTPSGALRFSCFLDGEAVDPLPRLGLRGN